MQVSQSRSLDALEYVSVEKLRKQLEHAKSIYGNLHADWSSIRGIELDSLNRLHMHTICCFPNNISCKTQASRFAPDSSWHIHFRPFPFKDFAKVSSYVTKQSSRDVDLDDQRSMESILQRKLKKKRIV